MPPNKVLYTPFTLSKECGYTGFLSSMSYSFRDLHSNPPEMYNTLVPKAFYSLSPEIYKLAIKMDDAYPIALATKTNV